MAFFFFKIHLCFVMTCFHVNIKNSMQWASIYKDNHRKKMNNETTHQNWLMTTNLFIFSSSFVWQQSNTCPLCVYTVLYASYIKHFNWTINSNTKSKINGMKNDDQMQQCFKIKASFSLNRVIPFLIKNDSTLVSFEYKWIYFCVIWFMNASFFLMQTQSNEYFNCKHFDNIQLLVYL